MSKVLSSVASTFTGGLIGGPEIKAPKVVQPKAQRTDIDPNRGAQIAAAKRRRAQAAKGGRAGLRIDLADEQTQTRSGISIGG